MKIFSFEFLFKVLSVLIVVNGNEESLMSVISSLENNVPVILIKV